MWATVTTWPTPDLLLSLSNWGFFQGFIWQPFTYLFVIESGAGGINLWNLFTLAFELYMLYWLGLHLEPRLGSKGFLTLFLGSGLLSGLLAIVTSWFLNSSTLLAGCSASLLTLYTVWAFLHPKQEVYLFFILKLYAIQVLWLILGLIALISLSRLDFITLVHYGSATLLGWGVYRMIYKPFPFRLSSQPPTSKIIPFPKSQEGESDEHFVDRMLEKISAKGEKSLTDLERRRLDRISKTKSKTPDQE